MRVALIHPAVYDDRGELVQHRHLSGRAAPLGLYAVAAATPPEHSIEIVEEVVAGSRLPIDADVVGIHVNTINARRAYEVADRYRQRGIPVVLGGIHASLAPDEAQSHADAVVVGEAELSWPQLLQDLASDCLEPRYAPGRFADLAGVPLPRYDLVPRANYHRRLLGMVVAYETARGCPHSCEFCVVPTISGRRHRTKPIDQVVGELKSILATYEGIRPLRFFFVDDNLCANPPRARDLFDAITPLGITFAAMLTPKTAQDEELIRGAARAGLRVAFLGLESLSNRGLGSVGKTFLKAEDYAEHLSVFARHGILVDAAIIFGLEGDTTEVFHETIDFLTAQRVAIAHFEPLVPLPGTRLYARFEQEGRLLQPDYWLSPKYDMFRIWQHDQLSGEEFRNAYRRATQSFFSLKNILYRLAAPPNAKHLPWLLPYNLLLRKMYRANRNLRA